MNAHMLVSLEGLQADKRDRADGGKILLVKPPFFTPWTPPLGISILKAYLEKRNYSVRCFDYNTDSLLWGTHHKYFAAIQQQEDVSINDGYSKLWWVLNAHMLAYLNGADANAITKVLETIIPLFGIHCDSKVIRSLLPIIERYFNRLAEMTDSFDLSDFSVVGTSSYTTSLSSSLFLLRQLKKKYPHLKTVMGGGIFADDLALGSDNLTTLLEEYHFVDHVILGEGEMLFDKLLTGELAHKRVISIADAGGKTMEMREIPAPDFSDLNPEHYYHLTIEGARSCPFQCSFCSETVQWGDYRKKPIDLFVDQIIGLAQKYNNRSFFMGDSLMNPYIFQFSNALLEKKANVLYDGYLRADKPVTWREKVKLWRRSGLYRARLGIESAAARVLNSMDKKTSPQVISEVLKSLSNAGIRTTTYWIVGFPGETEDDFQETCEFIKEHHHFIYELEAHPYYYYPYGQIGSRLHQCYSLYPEEVTKIIKFRVWEIMDANPTRDVRYDRLNRISKLAADLGLPNIYTMAERYVAEERWQRLHPLAAEIYEGTRICREEVILPEHGLEAFSQEYKSEAAASPFFCFEVSIGKKVDETKLSEAADYLIRYNEILRMRFEGGKYFPIPEMKPRRGDSILSIFNCEGHGEEEKDLVKQQFITRIAGEIRPEGSEAIRIAIFRNEEASYQLLLCAHRALVDGQGVVILLEDLFRAYEQLSNENEVTLLPTFKTYTEFIKETVSARPEAWSNLTTHQSQAAEARPEQAPENEGTVAASFDLQKGLLRRISSKVIPEFDLKPAEVFEIAFLRVLARVRRDLPIDVKADYRLIDSKLERTVGAFTTTYHAPFEMQEELLKDAHRIGQVLKGAFRRAVENGLGHTTGLSQGRILLNLEYFVEEPWLGGDAWTPRGFVVNENSLNGKYLLEVTPITNNMGVEVRMNRSPRGEAKVLAEALAETLGREIEALLDYFERFNSAKQFWEQEFGKEPSDFHFEIESNEQTRTATERALMSCATNKWPLEKLASEYGVDEFTLLLSAFSLLLSRLHGREEARIVSVVMRDQEMKLIPLSFYPSWNLSFRTYIGEMKRKISLGTQHATYAYEILTQVLPDSTPGFQVPIFDAGYTYDSGSGGLINAIAQHYPAISGGLDLFLEVIGRNENQKVQFNYENRRYDSSVIDLLRSCLENILKEASENPDVHLGEIDLRVEKKDGAANVDLSQDNFNF